MSLQSKMSCGKKTINEMKRYKLAILQPIKLFMENTRQASMSDRYKKMVGLFYQTLIATKKYQLNANRSTSIMQQN